MRGRLQSFCACLGGRSPSMQLVAVLPPPRVPLSTRALWGGAWTRASSSLCPGFAERKKIVPFVQKRPVYKHS